MKLTNYHFLSFALPATLVAQSVDVTDQSACGSSPEGEMVVIGESESSSHSPEREEG